MNSNSSRSRKVLIAGSTLLVAGAVAVGSGASFNSQSTHSAAVTAGILKHSNDQDGQTLTVTKIKPGDKQSGSLAITNDGDLDSTLSLQETDDATGFLPGDLQLTIAQGDKTLYEGDFGALDNSKKLDLGALAVGDTTRVTYTVSMPTSAGNDNQGKSAKASFRYVTTQAGDNSGIKWLP